MPVFYIPNFGPVRLEGTRNEIVKQYEGLIAQYATPQKGTFSSNFTEGLTTLGGLDEAVAYSTNPTPENRERLLALQGKKVNTTFDDVEKDFADGNYMKGLSGLFDFASQTAGGSIGSQVAPAAAGLAGLVSPVPGGATAGYLGASTAQYFVTNATRQAEEAAKAEKLNQQVQSPDLVKNLLAAGASSILDRAGFGILGFTGKKAASELAKETFGKTVLKGGALGIAAEVPQEVAQQGLERYQAGLDLTGDEANKEYKEAIAGAAILGGPLGSTGRFAERMQARQDVPPAADNTVNNTAVDNTAVAPPEQFEDVPDSVLSPVMPSPAPVPTGMVMPSPAPVPTGMVMPSPAPAAQEVPEASVQETETTVAPPPIAQPDVSAPPVPVTIADRLALAKEQLGEVAIQNKIAGRAPIKRVLAADLTDPVQYEAAVSDLSKVLLNLSNSKKPGDAEKAQAVKSFLVTLPTADAVAQSKAQPMEDENAQLNGTESSLNAQQGDLRGPSTDGLPGTGGDVPADSLRPATQEAPVANGPAGTDVGSSLRDSGGVGDGSGIQSEALKAELLTKRQAITTELKSLDEELQYITELQQELKNSSRKGALSRSQGDAARQESIALGEQARKLRKKAQELLDARTKINYTLIDGEQSPRKTLTKKDALKSLDDAIASDIEQAVERKAARATDIALYNAKYKAEPEADAEATLTKPKKPKKAKAAPAPAPAPLPEVPKLKVGDLTITDGDRFVFRGAKEENFKVGDSYLRPDSNYTIRLVNDSKVAVQPETGKPFYMSTKMFNKAFSEGYKFEPAVRKQEAAKFTPEQVQEGSGLWNEQAPSDFQFDALPENLKDRWLDSAQSAADFDAVLADAQLKEQKPDYSKTVPQTGAAFVRASEKIAPVADVTEQTRAEIEARLAKEAPKAAPAKEVTIEELTQEAEDEVAFNKNRESGLKRIADLETNEDLLPADVSKLAAALQKEDVLLPKEAKWVRSMALQDKDPVGALKKLKEYVTKAKYGDEGAAYRLKDGNDIGGVAPDVAEKIADAYRSGKAAPTIKIARSLADLPPKVASEIKAKKLKPKGFLHLPTNVVYILPENNKDVGDLMVTLEHEIVGHYGMRAFLGNAYEATMKAAMDNAVVKTQLDGRDPTLRNIEEAIAEIAELGAQGRLPAQAKSLFGRLRALLNRFLRNLGMTRALTDSELFGIIANSKAYVATGVGRGKGKAQTYSNAVFRDEDAKVLSAYTSKLNDAINNIENPYTKESVDKAYDRITTLPDDARNFTLKLLNLSAITQGINRIMPKSLPLGTMIDKVVGRRSGTLRSYEEKTLQPVIDRGESIAANKPEQYKKLNNELAYKSREYRIDASVDDPFKAGYTITEKEDGELRVVVDPRYTELRKVYDSLDSDVQELYKDVVKTGSKLFDDFMTTLTDLVDAQIATGANPSVANQIKDRLLGREYEVRAETDAFDAPQGGKTNITRFRNKVDADEAVARNPGATIRTISSKQITPYFAHIRPGRYLLSYTDKNGMQHYPSFVSDRAREEARKELATQGIKATSFEFDRSGLRNSDGTDYTLIEDILRQLDSMDMTDEQQMDFFNILVDALPESDALGNLKAAKEYGGYNQDVVRGLAVSGNKMATLIANTQFQSDMVPIRNSLEAANEILSGKSDIVAKTAEREEINYADLTDDEIRLFLRDAGRTSRNLTVKQYKDLVELRDSKGFKANDYRKDFASYTGELRDRMRIVQNPLSNRTANMVAGYSYKFLLGANVASALIQVAQIPSVALPLLAGKYNWKDASKYLWEATKLFSNTGSSRKVLDGSGKVSDTQGDIFTKSIGNLPEAELKKLGLFELMQEAEARGVLRTSVISEVNRAMYNQTGYKNTLAGRIGRKVDLALSGMFHVAEELNREATLVAAFKLAKDSGMSTQDAIDDAIRMTDYANGQTAAENAPSITKNTIGKIMFTFKRYAVSMLYMQFDTARRALQNADPVERKVALRQIAGLYTMSFMVAGVFGMPFMGVVRMLANAMLGDDDEPYDLKLVAENSLGGMIARGPLSYATGLDIGSRVKQTDFLLNDEVPNSSGLTEEILLSIGGPAVGIAKNWMRASDLIAQGEFERGIETAMPSAVKNLMKAARFTAGGTETLEGEKIYDDFGPYSLAAQAIGFTPLELAQAYSVRGYLKEMDKAITSRRSSLLGASSVAKLMGDTSGYNAMLEKIAQFNKDHPENPITPSSMAKSLAAKTKSRSESYRGVTLNDKLQDVLMQDIQSIDDEIED